jgi:precorrin-6A/cobalt-precorrin-6A reductase
MPGMGTGTPPGGDPRPGQRIPDPPGTAPNTAPGGVAGEELGSCRVLILGGTGQARRLAGELTGRPGLRVVTSLAGRLTTGAGLPPPGEVRRGGFGGPEGLESWLAAEGIELVVDATHPFAARISRSAVLATGDSHLLRLRRPGWVAGPGDRWRRVPDLPSAAEEVRRRGRRVFLAVGRQSVAAFAGVERVSFLLRAIEAPEGPVPPDLQVVLGRGPFTLSGELELMRCHAIDTVVTKDSGGEAARAKLLAARELGLPVVMVDRPPLPGSSPVVRTVAEARDLVLSLVASGPRGPRGGFPER